MTIADALPYTPYAITGTVFLVAGILYARLRRGEKLLAGHRVGEIQA